MSAATKRETRKIEILRKAAASFRRLGYHRASMREIADALGMATGSLYYYFKDKEEILFCCHEFILQRQLRLLQDIEKTVYPPEVKLRRLLSAWIHEFMDEPHSAAILGTEINELSSARLKRVIAKRDKIDQGVRVLIDGAITAGAFRQEDPKLLSFAIFGALNWIPMWFDPRGPATSSEIAEVFVDCFFQGLLVRNASAEEKNGLNLPRNGNGRAVPIAS